MYSFIERYKEIFTDSISLFLYPEQGWKKIDEKYQDFTYIRDNVFIPMMLLLLVSTIFGLLINDIDKDEVSYWEYIFRNTVFELLKFFIYYYLSVIVLSYMSKLFLGKYSGKEDSYILVISKLLTFPFCVLILSECMSQIWTALSFTYYLSIILNLLLIWGGVDYYCDNLTDKKRTIISFIVTVYLIVMGLLVGKVINKMMF